MTSAIRRRLDTGQYDLLICDDIYNVSNMPRTSVPILLNKHDLTHVIVRRYLHHEQNHVRRMYAKSEYLKLRRWEALACAQVGRVLVVSDVDLELLAKACPAARYAYAPNVIDVHQYPITKTDNGRTILYVGSMDWPPNRDAVQFFIHDVMPRLRTRLPQAEFVVAGRGPEKRLRRRLERVPHVRFTGTVADMRVELAQAVVCVVPLRIGSGTRLKILEAGAMGKPVVSTTIGAEGLTFHNGQELYLADNPADFASSIEALFRDPDRRRELGAAARRKVESEYSVEALQRAMRAALTTLLPIGDMRVLGTALGR
jgi:glycosyltransferase involved in cell wall biosynthesis